MKTQIQGHSVSMYQRGEIWWYDTFILDKRVRGSCHTTDVQAAISWLENKLSDNVCWQQVIDSAMATASTAGHSTAKRIERVLVAVAEIPGDEVVGPIRIKQIQALLPVSYHQTLSTILKPHGIECPQAAVLDQKRTATANMRAEVEVYTPFELKTLTEAIRGQPIYRLFTILKATGMRPGEAFALSWPEDFQRMEAGWSVVVSKTRHGDRTTGMVKTDSGNRIIPIPDAVIDIVSSTIGPIWPFSNRYAQKVWNGIVQSCGLLEGIPVVRHRKRMELYTLRRTALTNMATAGIDPIRLAQIAGHSSPSVTMRYYLSNRLSQDNIARQAMNELI